MSDFLIIGGGIAGISAAARLSELGSVTVIEAEGTLAHHASGRSAALYEPRAMARLRWWNCRWPPKVISAPPKTCCRRAA